MDDLSVDFSPFRRRRAKARLAGAMLASALALSDPAAAGSAYGIRTQSTSALGSAQAGMTAGPYDLSRLSLNPAALGLGSGTEIVSGLSGIFLQQRANSVDATTSLGTPTGGGQGGNAGTANAIPHFYAAMDIDEQLRLGIGVSSYTGLGSKWDPGWAGRYYVRSASIMSADITPVISYRPIPSLIMAGGPIIEYVRLKNTTALDLGSVDRLLMGGAFGGVPGGHDGALGTRSDSWSAGLILGATYEPWEGTRLGVSWRSQVRHKLRGDADFSTGGAVGQGLAAATGAFTDSRIRSSLNNPSALTFGISQDVTPALTLFADVQRMGWSSVQEVTLRFDNPAQPPVRGVLALRDSWYVAFGGRYQIDERFALRAGFAFDEAASRDTTRTPLLPDNFALWTAIGLEVRLSDRMRLDFAYGHLFSGDAALRQTAAQPGNELRGNFAGNTRTTSDFVSMQLAWKF